jgi:hypothetical protein
MNADQPEAMPETPAHPPLQVQTKTGQERFRHQAQELPITLSDFWSWAASDLVSNAWRGILAEFIVASALDLAKGLRREWAACDLITDSGVKVEVKSSAYLQTWSQRSFSKIVFSIGPTHYWDEQNGPLDPEKKRQADVYVFCLLKTKDINILNPLDLDQWEFFLVPTSVLNGRLNRQNSLTLAGLVKLKPRQSDYAQLKMWVETLGQAERRQKDEAVGQG